MSELKSLFEELNTIELARLLIEAGNIGDDETCKIIADIIKTRKPATQTTKLQEGGK